MLAPFGVGVLYARPRLLRAAAPFLYGGDMIAEGQVFPDHVGYNALPWKFSAGTPNILGAIVSAQAMRLLVDLALSPRRPAYFRTARPLRRDHVHAAMRRIAAWNRQLTARALDGLAAVPGITIYGPPDPVRRTSLVAFNARRSWPSTSPAAIRWRWPSHWTGRGWRPGRAVTAPPSPTTRSASARPRAAGSASTSTTPCLTSTRRWPPSPPAQPDVAGHRRRGGGPAAHRNSPAGRTGSSAAPRGRAVGASQIEETITMLTVIPCPECDAPAEIAERFSLPSTDGPVAHVVVYCVGGHHFRMPADRLAPPRRAAPAVPRRTIQVCIRCQQSPAGFWVRQQSGSVVRRPWCLACCTGLDRARCEVIPFGP
jgi:hypothetical protein